MSRIAVIGGGIAGLGCAYFLHRHHDVTVFESAAEPGGHVHTVDVLEPESARRLPVDTGFMAFSRRASPLVSRLFDTLRVPVKRAPLSYSVRDDDSHIEWNGWSLGRVFAQRRNLLNRRFHRLLFAVHRFHRETPGALRDPRTAGLTLHEFIVERGYDDDFFRLYLAPLCAAAWGTPPELMLQFPALLPLRFFAQQGFLALHPQHLWWTVDGGGREYLRRLTAGWAQRIRLGDGATRVVRTPRGTIVMTRQGQAHTFDQVIVATHADHALRLVVNPTADELRLLAAFRYQTHTAVVHGDATVMPRTRRAWASRNVHVARDRDGHLRLTTHYWMNAIQGFGDDPPCFVSLDRPPEVNPAKVFRSIEFEHPLFTLETLRAQTELPQLNAAARSTTRTFFAGSYFGDGFHEDALRSAYDVARLILGREPWP